MNKPSRLESFQTNSKLLWDCIQSLVKLGSGPGEMGTDINEIADGSARQSSSYPLIGSEPALFISAKVAWRVIRDSISRKHEEHCQPICGQMQAKNFLYNTSTKELQNTQLEQKPAKNTDRADNRILPIKEYLFKLGQVKSPECDRCKQTSETTSHIFVTEALATLRFRHLGHQFMKPCDFEDISVSRIPHFV